MVMVSRLLRDKQDTYRELPLAHILPICKPLLRLLQQLYPSMPSAPHLKVLCIKFSQASSSARIYVQSVTSGRQKNISRGDNNAYGHTHHDLELRAPDGGCLDLTISLKHDCYRRWHQRILDFSFVF